MGMDRKSALCCFDLDITHILSCFLYPYRICKDLRTLIFQTVFDHYILGNCPLFSLGYQKRIMSGFPYCIICLVRCLLNRKASALDLYGIGILHPSGIQIMCGLIGISEAAMVPGILCNIL